MRELRFRARFKKISNNKECWQFALLQKGMIIDPIKNLLGYIQITEWEQDTGLVNKNGEPIFEGDILNSKNDGNDGCDVWGYGDHVNLVVMWNDKSCCFAGLPETSGVSVHDISRIETLGNIYQNPELLEEKP